MTELSNQSRENTAQYGQGKKWKSLAASGNLAVDFRSLVRPSMQFIQQRLVANIQSLRRLPSIPVQLIQRAEDQLFLYSLRGVGRQVLQRDAIPRIGIDCLRLVGLELRQRLLQIRKEEVPPDGVFQL